MGDQDTLDKLVAEKAEAASKAAWNKADKCVYGDLRRNSEWERINSQVGGVPNLQDIQILSDLADHHGCGNCGELSAITFMYLYILDFRPLDFMALKFPADCICWHRTRRERRRRYPWAQLGKDCGRVRPVGRRVESAHTCRKPLRRGSYPS